jgi:CRISPR/Cas system CSM-associated protein Csm3 (group 7 of RAMP superfamily)
MVGSGFGIAGLVDSSTVKDSNGIIYLPASSIKGKIKSEFKKNIESLFAGFVCNSIISGRKSVCQNKDIQNACIICRIFGSEFYEGSLIFEDAVMDVETQDILGKIEKNKILPVFQSSIRSGTKINRLLKTTEEGALFSMEGVNPAIVLASNINGSCYMSEDEYNYFKGTIQTITHLGGNKARGMGRCIIEIVEV